MKEPQDLARLLNSEHWYRQRQGPEERVGSRDLRLQVIRQLLTLTDRERYIIEQRFGLGDGPARTLQDIGQDVGGVTGNRVRQIEAKALRKLRHPYRSRWLVPFITGNKPKARVLNPQHELRRQQALERRQERRELREEEF